MKSKQSNSNQIIKHQNNQNTTKHTTQVKQNASTHVETVQLKKTNNTNQTKSNRLYQME